MEISGIISLMEDVAIAAFEASTKIASLAVISDSGKVLYQSKNWDLNNQWNGILEVLKGNKEFIFNSVKFLITEAKPTGIIGINEGGMGSVLFIPFYGGVLLSYVMPGTNPNVALNFLQPYSSQLSEKIHSSP